MLVYTNYTDFGKSAVSCFACNILTEISVSFLYYLLIFPCLTCYHSASYDASVRIWDTEQGVCLHSLTKHEQPVNSISWHPDGDFLVSGALDGVINIWNTKVSHMIQNNFKEYPSLFLIK